MRRSAEMSLWQGRLDSADGPDALRWHQRTHPYRPDTPPGTVLLGVCSDEGVRRNQGRPGAAAGPDAIRRALAGQAWHLDGPLYDAGNLMIDGDNLEALQEEQAGMVATLLDAGHFPLLLGGGHEIACGSGCGLLRHLQRKKQTGRIGVINCDAHFDLRNDPRASSGTPFAQLSAATQEAGFSFHYLCLGISRPANSAALFRRAAELRTVIIEDRELVPWNLAPVENRLHNFIADCDALYLSIDLDLLPAAVAPGVSAPATRGLPLEILEHLLERIRRQAGKKLRLADIAEYNPTYDIDGRTAKVAARLCHLLLNNSPPSHQEHQEKQKT
ncbi:formimidoylglutamase [Geothermobacter hydrogeniphilus]|uniref:Formimidoylglutamase n=1 Tax=Geothermobacter hydrogeniphilus TaxID=1969733 RepID=A0A1X0YAZ7_9BACT|nr:formimidoylglutamase [Geothermobacter hydrogeniphilus]ORJ62400.1 formimidoylglutamase [Geothermobacter hydrogeniphilus]